MKHRKRIARERGQTLAEFSLVAPVLFILVFGLIDTARLFHAWVTIQHAAREGARYGVTGRSDCGAATPSRPACIEYTARQHTEALVDTPNDLTVTTWNWQYPAYGNPSASGPGDQCDALEVRLEYDFTASTPLIGNIFGPVHLTARERLVNEPFGPCN